MRPVTTLPFCPVGLFNHSQLCNEKFQRESTKMRPLAASTYSIRRLIASFGRYQRSQSSTYFLRRAPRIVRVLPQPSRNILIDVGANFDGTLSGQLLAI